MKTAVFSLLIAISVALLSLFQFEKYQKLSHNTQITFGKLENKITSKVEELDTNINLLKGQDQAILNHIKFGTWVIAEIEYLVNLATTQLEMTRDVQSATFLLTKAKEKVQRLNDPNLDSLQNALSTDLENLRNFSSPDLRMLWLKIGTLIKETTRLTPQQSFSKSLKKDDSPTEVAHTNSKSWKELFQENFQEMKELVKIQQHAKPIEPILSQTERVLVRENLRLLLEQTRLAVLTADSEIYQSSIQDVHDWLTTYYPDTQSDVRNIQHSLYSMSKIILNPTLPTITAVDHLQNLKALR